MRPALSTDKKDHRITDKYVIDAQEKEAAAFAKKRKEKTDTKRHLVSTTLAIIAILLTVLGLQFWSC